MRAAKLNGGGSKPEIAGETPRKKAQGREASFLFRIDCKRAHASAKGGPSAMVEAIDDDESYDDDIASAGQLDNMGREPIMAGGGVSRRRKAERRHPSSALTP